MALPHPKPVHHLFKDLENQRFGRLLVIAYAGRKTKRNVHHWLCRCDCGNEIEASGSNLGAGSHQSCGCLARELAAKRGRERTGQASGRWVHGEAKKPERVAWFAMIHRCYDQEHKWYKDYGQRGITVCQRWLDSYDAFLADMGRRPSPSHSLDRIDNDGNYEPGNCRWATKQEQSRNSRHNRIVTFNGESKLIVEWSEVVGINQITIATRLDRGWSIEKALTKRPQRRRQLAQP